MSKKQPYHIVRNPDGGWAIKRSGAARASEVHDRKSDAIRSARTISRSHGGVGIVIHNKDGRIIRESNTGNIVRDVKTGRIFGKSTSSRSTTLKRAKRK